MVSLLEQLRSSSSVSCDTMDVRVAETLGAFEDCTSNQAIAFFELSKISDGKLQHEALIKEAIEEARGPLKLLQHEQSLEEFVVDILMIKLQLQFLPHITGYVHVQTNPKLADYRDIVDRARSLHSIAIELLRHKPQTQLRMCIKIPGTWHGIQACKALENSGPNSITTLATIMFRMEQAALAHDAGCTYIAPYVNELRVHFDSSYTDKARGFDFCWEAQAYYTERKSKTTVLAASLTSVEEVMSLSGIRGITISPPLLQQLASQPPSPQRTILSTTTRNATRSDMNLETIVKDEAMWSNAFKKSGNGECFRKLEQAVQYFCEFQNKLEELVSPYASARCGGSKQ